jgi:hypothetical protein
MHSRFRPYSATHDVWRGPHSAMIHNIIASIVNYLAEVQFKPTRKVRCRNRAGVTCGKCINATLSKSDDMAQDGEMRKKRTRRGQRGPGQQWISREQAW